MINKSVKYFLIVLLFLNISCTEDEFIQGDLPDMQVSKLEGSAQRFIEVSCSDFAHLAIHSLSYTKTSSEYIYKFRIKNEGSSSVELGALNIQIPIYHKYGPNPVLFKFKNLFYDGEYLKGKTCSKQFTLRVQRNSDLANFGGYFVLRLMNGPTEVRCYKYIYDLYEDRCN